MEIKLGVTAMHYESGVTAVVIIIVKSIKYLEYFYSEKWLV